MSNPKISEIKKLLLKQKTGVLATQSKDYPYTSVIAFAAQEDLTTLFFATKRHTQKYRNMQNKDKISLMIDNRTDGLTDFSANTTLTVLGRTSEVEKQTYKEWYLSHHPQLHEFLDHSDCTMIKIDVDTFILVQDFQKVSTIHRNDL